MTSAHKVGQPLPRRHEGTKPIASKSIAIVGSGAMGVYMAKALQEAGSPARVVLFEASSIAGPGTAYNREGNSREMLANIASIELPPVTETLCGWLSRQPQSVLQEWDIAQSAQDERAFFPRFVLGAYFAAQLRALETAARGGSLVVRTAAEVVDVVARLDAVLVRWRDGAGELATEMFDSVVIATGYSSGRGNGIGQMAGDGSEARGHRIGVLGTSLGAIDAVMAQACQRGRFVAGEAGLVYHPEQLFSLTMFSRKGLLPEADFWFPVPGEELDIFTSEALARLVHDDDGDLDRVFSCFCQQLWALDAEYCTQIDLGTACADTFAERYFAARMREDPFAYAARNLAEAQVSHEKRITSAWRYGLLRMHGVFAEILPLLGEQDRARFDRGLKDAFIDNYAAVPHLSIERLLALHASGVLEVVTTGGDYTLDEGHLDWPGGAMVFDQIIDARGQRPLELEEVALPTLRLQLCARAEAGQGQDLALDRLHILAMPLLLRDNPFAQGLVECHALTQKVAAKMTSADVQDTGSVIRQLIDELEHTQPVYCGEAGIIHLPESGRQS